MTMQEGWRWCSKCQGLVYGEAACAAGGNHGVTTSGFYSVDMDNPAALGQRDWRWCSKCHGLCFSDSGTCPASGGHDTSASSSYTLPHAPDRDPEVDGQQGWRWCSKCQGLHFGVKGGHCPAGGEHDGTVSGHYAVHHRPRPVERPNSSPADGPAVFDRPTAWALTAAVPVVVTSAEVAWLRLRDLARRANQLALVVSTGVRQMAPWEAALALYHSIGLEVGFASALSPDHRAARRDALLRHAKRYGLDGIEALLLNEVFDAVERRDRVNATAGAKLLDGWFRIRGGKLQTGRLPVIDASGVVSIVNGFALAKIGLNDILAEVDGRAELASRLANLRPGRLEAGAAETSGGPPAPGVTIKFFTPGAVVEIAINGQGLDIITGTAENGAKLGRDRLGDVGATVGWVAGAVVGFFGMLAEGGRGAEVEKQKNELAETLEKMAQQIKEDIAYVDNLIEKDRKNEREKEEKEKKEKEKEEKEKEEKEKAGGTGPKDGDDPPLPEDPDGATCWEEGASSGQPSPAEIEKLLSIYGPFQPRIPVDGRDDPALASKGAATVPAWWNFEGIVNPLLDPDHDAGTGVPGGGEGSFVVVDPLLDPDRDAAPAESGSQLRIPLGELRSRFRSADPKAAKVVMRKSDGVTRSSGVAMGVVLTVVFARRR